MPYSSESIELSLPALKENLEKIEKASEIHINIDREDILYKEFSCLLQRLYEKGIDTIFIKYKGKILDISSHGMEWKLPVKLPNSPKKEMRRFPFCEKIKTTQGCCMIVYWKVNIHDRNIDIIKFSKYISSLEKKDLGISFIVDPNVPVKELMEYISSLPVSLNLKGILFNAL